MRKIVIVIILIISVLFGIRYFYKMKHINTNNSEFQTQNDNDNENIILEKNNNSEVIIDDWRLTLANYENSLPEDFEIELAKIDNTRQFDKRAINELLIMMKDIKKAGIQNVWIQSAYRSMEYQQGLFDEKVNKYILQGRTREEAEKLTLQTINRPGTSDHNLGLAVDFNYVNYSFDDTKGFKWLLENAENYGFILRYRKDKEDITKVNYEPWHWRYVGVEHAKKINELDMCLEEYIEYLKNNYST